MELVIRKNDGHLWTNYLGVWTWHKDEESLFKFVKLKLELDLT